MRVKEMYASGIIRQIWARGDTPGAAILWEGGSEDEVRAALTRCPSSKPACSRSPYFCR